MPPTVDINLRTLMEIDMALLSLLGHLTIAGVDVHVRAAQDGDALASGEFVAEIDDRAEHLTIHARQPCDLITRAAKAICLSRGQHTSIARAMEFVA